MSSGSLRVKGNVFRTILKFVLFALTNEYYCPTCKPCGNKDLSYLVNEQRLILVYPVLLSIPVKVTLMRVSIPGFTGPHGYIYHLAFLCLAHKLGGAKHLGAP
jgi:hypothetical protein